MNFLVNLVIMEARKWDIIELRCKKYKHFDCEFKFKWRIANQNKLETSSMKYRIFNAKSALNKNLPI
jgi:hypothetical protein